MDNSRWFRFMAIGLVLAAVAVGYFLLTGKLGSKSITKTQNTPNPTVLGQNTQTASTPVPLATASPSPSSAYNRIVNRTQNNAQTLPATGFPVGLAVVFSVSALISGWGLRRFPK